MRQIMKTVSFRHICFSKTKTGLLTYKCKSFQT